MVVGVALAGCGGGGPAAPSGGAPPGGASPSATAGGAAAPAGATRVAGAGDPVGAAVVGAGGPTGAAGAVAGAPGAGVAGRVGGDDGPVSVEEHRLRRVQELREDRAAAEAHAAKAVEQATVEAPRAPLPEGARTTRPAEVAALRAQKSNVLLVDPRPDVAFRRAHAEGASHVPAASLALREVPVGPGSAQLVLIGAAEGDPSVAAAARSLLARGVDFTVVAGGLDAWEQAGLPVVRIDQGAGPDAPLERVTGAELLAEAGGVAGGRAGELIDVRPVAAWEAGHVPGSRNVPAATLAEALLPEGAALIVAADDAAAERAARALLARGAPRVRVLEGGVVSWVRAGGRLASGRQQ